MTIFPEIDTEDDIERLTRNGTLAGFALSVPLLGYFVTVVLSLTRPEAAGIGDWALLAGASLLVAVPLLIATFRVSLAKRRFSTVPLFCYIALNVALIPIYPDAIIGIPITAIVLVYLINAHRAIEVRRAREEGM